MKTHNNKQTSYRVHVINPFSGIPELQAFGYDDLRSALSLTEHSHPNAFEFVFIERGQATWDIFNSQQFETRAGDVFHTRPGELHRGSNDSIDPCRFWWLIIEVPSLKLELDSQWLQLEQTDCEQLLKGLWQLPRVITTGTSASEPLKRLKSAVERQDSLATLEARVSLLDFLLVLLRPELNHAIPEDVLKSLKMIISEIELRPDWRPSVSELADATDMSPSHFYRVFQEYTGSTPMSFIQRSRIEKACRRLKETGDSITDIALDFGFTSSQHFATVFKRTTGRTPTEWRK